jgi:hypothetical protein
MRPRPAPFLAIVLVLLACTDPSEPPPSDDTGTTAAASSSSSSSGLDTRGDSTTAAVDTTAGSGSATGGTSSSSGPGESSSSESTGPTPVNGCADGEREALEDDVAYPDIAACAGGFMVPGVLVNVPYCDRAGGDDGLEPAGMGCSVEDLCSEGWHVCVDRLEVMAAGVANCGDEAISWGGNSFFATRQSGEGANTCNATGLNDVFGCGDVGYTNIMGCAPLNRSSANGCSMLPAPWDCDTSLTQEAEFIVKDGPEFGGVLCCRD